MPLTKFSLETLTCVQEDSDWTASVKPYLWTAAVVIDSNDEPRDGQTMHALFRRAALCDKSPPRPGKDAVASQETPTPAEQGHFAFYAKSPSQSRYRFILIVLLWDEDIADEEFDDVGRSGLKRGIGQSIDRAVVARLLTQAAQRPGS